MDPLPIYPTWKLTFAPLARIIYTSLSESRALGQKWVFEQCRALFAMYFTRDNLFVENTIALVLAFAVFFFFFFLHGLTFRDFFSCIDRPRFCSIIRKCQISGAQIDSESTVSSPPKSLFNFRFFIQDLLQRIIWKYGVPWYVANEISKNSDHYSFFNSF